MTLHYTTLQVLAAIAPALELHVSGEEVDSRIAESQRHILQLKALKTLVSHSFSRFRSEPLIGSHDSVMLSLSPVLSRSLVLSLARSGAGL